MRALSQLFRGVYNYHYQLHCIRTVPVLYFERLGQQGTHMLVNKLNSNFIFPTTNININFNSEASVFPKARDEKRASEEVSEEDP